MNLNSLQVCMDGPDWQQICHVMAPDEQRTDSSSPSEEMITCPRPVIERRLRPQQDQALKCPRCDSTHTKFCYYNNYSLSQPRYFCKTCRRYWTKGGSLRNVPVGGGCRKNKKVAAAKKPIDPPSNPHLNLSYDATDLHLSFPGLQLAHLNNLYGNSADLNLKQSKYDLMPGDPRDANFMENKLNVMLGNSREYTFLENNDSSHLGGGIGGVSHGFASSSLHGLCSPFGFSIDGSQGTYMEVGEKTLLPFGGSEDPNSIDIKPPNNKYLSLERQEEGCSEIGKDPFGHLMSGLGSWSGVMNG